MIKNILFDMGNVLIKFHPSEIVAKVFPNPSVQALISKEVFQTQAWESLDQGLITVDQHYQRLAIKFPQHAEKIDWILKNWYKNPTEIPGMLELVTKLKKAGFDRYILSNANAFFYTRQPYLAIFELFTGVTLSSELKVLKPHKEIFDRFCQIHGLLPSECLLIDDQARNIYGAREAGLQAHQFIDATELEFFLKTILGSHGFP